MKSIPERVGPRRGRMLRALTASAAAAMLLLTSACASSGGGGGESGDGLVHMDVGVFPIVTWLPDQVASNQGFFRDNGLDVTLVGPSMAGPTAFALMSSNKLQAYAQDYLTVYLAISQGNEVKISACQAPGSVYVWVARTDIGLPTSGDFEEKVLALKGKKVGVTALGAGTDRMMTTAAAAVGMSDTDVNRIGVGAPDAAASQMKAGAIDAYVTGSISGALAVAESVGDGKAAVYLQANDPTAPDTIRLFDSIGWMMPAQWAEDNPDTVAAYRKSLQQAVQWIKDNPDEAADLMSRVMLGGAQLDLAKESVASFTKDYIDPDPTLSCSPEPFAATDSVFEQFDLGPMDNLGFDKVTLPSARE